MAGTVNLAQRRGLRFKVNDSPGYISAGLDL